MPIHRFLRCSSGPNIRSWVTHLDSFEDFSTVQGRLLPKEVEERTVAGDRDCQLCREKQRETPEGHGWVWPW